jgi:hypothetical protein
MRNRESLGYCSVVALGIGGMVGGGIFAVLGLAVQRPQRLWEGSVIARPKSWTKTFILASRDKSGSMHQRG